MAARRRIRNRAVRSKVKTYISKAERSILSAEKESAPAAVQQAISNLDRAVVNGIIHRNSAARRKARLVKKLNLAGISAAEKTEPEEK